MYLGSFQSVARTSVTIPGFAVKISLATVVDVLCKRLFGFNCSQQDGCAKLAQYNTTALRAKIVDTLSSMVTENIPTLGTVDCSRFTTTDAMMLIANSFNISVSSGGVSIDVDFQPAAQAGMSRLICELMSQVMKASHLLDPIADTIVTYIYDTMCPSGGGSGGVTVNNAPRAVNPPQATNPPPSSQSEPRTAFVAVQFAAPRKTNYVPVLVAGGLALGVSVLILSRRR